MRTPTLLAAACAALLAHQAAAQTELPATPQPQNLPGPAKLPAAPLPPSTPGPASSLYSHSALNIELGWGAPYGWGVSYAHLVGPSTDVTVGVGLGVGGKIGVGVRQYLAPMHKLSPYFGLNVARTGRLTNVSIDLDKGLPTEEHVVYSQRPAGVLHLRSGLRWQLGTVGLLGSLGYGVRFTGNPVEYGSGIFPSSRMRDIIDIISPGGLELSMGVAINLGR